MFDEKTVTLTVNPVNDPPVITSALSVAATEHQLFSYTATATDPEGKSLTFSFSAYPAWMTVSGAVISGTPPEGSTAASFKVKASDGSLFDEKTVTVTLQAVNDKPTITSPATASATEHQAFSYTATATDPEGNALTFSFSGQPAWLTASGAVISGTPPEGAANASFKVKASDGSLFDEKTVTVTLQAVNDKPTITSPATASATEHQAFSYTATATDPEGNALTFSFSGQPA